MLGLDLRPRLLLLTALRCVVCKRIFNSEFQMTSAQMAALFGAKMYAICPCCGMEMPQEEWTPQYKRNWTRRMKKLSKQVPHEQA